MIDASPDRITVAITVMVCILTSLVGLLVGLGNKAEKTDIFYYLAGGVVMGLIVSWRWVWKILEGFFPERFRKYESTAEAVKQGDTIINIVIPEMGTYIIKGIELEVWRTIGEMVVESGKYTTTLFEQRFGRVDGRNHYDKITEQLKGASVLVDKGNGVAVTDHVGRHFFTQLSKGSYEVLKMVEPPTPH